MINLAIFGSGKGSNAKAIIEHFIGHEKVKVALLLCNRIDSGLIELGKAYGIPSIHVENQAFKESSGCLEQLLELKIDWIALAGFMQKIPDELVRNYNRRILNIHPSLLPAYGGQGMYGDRVHRAVIDAKEERSGISIHYVNEAYDEGEIIAQYSLQIKEGDGFQQLKEDIQGLEHKYYPKILETLICPTN